MNWNADTYYDMANGPSGNETIAERMKWVERLAEKEPDRNMSHCLEAVDYVNNYLKENNIVIEE